MDIKKVIELSKEYIAQGYTEREAVKKATKVIKEKEDFKYGIYSTTSRSYR